MKKFLLFLFVVALAFGITGVANAVLFEGSAIGEFENVISTDPSDYSVVANNDAGGVARFNWGIPATTTFNNQFTFDGVGSDGDPEWSVDSESAFLVGDFSYRNGSTTNSSGIDGVSLNIALTITNPLDITDTYLFDFDIVNTPNDPNQTPAENGDIVNVAGFFSNTTFTYDSVEYTLQLLGFSSDSGATIRTDFSSPEGATATAGLYAKITSEIPNQVPEPGTMLLFGVGLLGVLGFRRKFKK